MPLLRFCDYEAFVCIALIYIFEIEWNETQL